MFLELHVLSELPGRCVTVHIAGPSFQFLTQSDPGQPRDLQLTSCQVLLLVSTVLWGTAALITALPCKEHTWCFKSASNSTLHCARETERLLWDLQFWWRTHIEKDVVFKKPNILASKGSMCKTAEHGLLEGDLQPALLLLIDDSVCVLQAGFVTYKTCWIYKPVVSSIGMVCLTVWV